MDYNKKIELLKAKIETKMGCSLGVQGDLIAKELLKLLERNYLPLEALEADYWLRFTRTDGKRMGLKELAEASPKTEPTEPTSKIIQITAGSPGQFRALCKDGSIWHAGEIGINSKTYLNWQCLFQPEIIDKELTEMLKRHSEYGNEANLNKEDHPLVKHYDKNRKCSSKDNSWGRCVLTETLNLGKRCKFCGIKV